MLEQCITSEPVDLFACAILGPSHYAGVSDAFFDVADLLRREGRSSLILPLNSYGIPIGTVSLLFGQDWI